MHGNVGTLPFETCRVSSHALFVSSGSGLRRALASKESIVPKLERLRYTQGQCLLLIQDFPQALLTHFAASGV